MNELKTDASLIRAIELAAKRKPTAEEIQNQRVSYIIGTVRQSESMTKSRIREVLADQNGDRPS